MLSSATLQLINILDCIQQNMYSVKKELHLFINIQFFISAVLFLEPELDQDSK